MNVGTIYTCPNKFHFQFANLKVLLLTSEHHTNDFNANNFKEIFFIS